MAGRRTGAALAAAGWLLWALPAAAATHVAVFNFQMTSDTPQWRWLEKGLADRVITDLFQDGSITVVQRDEMQRLARSMRWAPEMTGDPDRLESLRKAVRAKYLVSGVYAVKDGRLSLSAFVVDFETKRQVARRAVAGPCVQALGLTRRLSAELLSWLTKRQAEKILSELPVWTRSLPASKALYDGVDLYDQGRYGEAWLNFRRAAREDPAYVEAQYWVGKMYYFMDRYAHARRAYERFVYMDNSHPRTGDAIKEFLHTYEKLDTPTQTLLGLYGDFLRRFPDVMIPSEMDVSFPVSNRAWLRTRSGQLLARLGRHREAVLLASSAMAEIQQKGRHHYWFPGYAGWACRVATSSCLTHNMLTGEVLVPDGLRTNYRRLARGGPDHVLQFRPGSSEAVAMQDKPLRLAAARSKSGRTLYQQKYRWHYVLAPDGHVFRKLTFHPLVDGTDALVRCTLCKDAFVDAGTQWAPVAEARRRGLTFDSIPRAGVFRLLLALHPKDKWRDPGITFRGVRAVAELEKVGGHGAVRVECGNTHDFRVFLGDRPARAGSGLIGLVPPGKHRLEVRPRHPGYPRASVQQAVTVEAGKLADVSVVLPWKKDSPWAAWTAGTLIGRDYPGPNACLQGARDAPSILADAHAIRVFWSYRGDLWLALSTDGQRFSRPAKLPMPISSGWNEQRPVCLRDESGRYVLAFRSDREAQHKRRAYVCWSRDAAHWSRPVMVADRPMNEFALIQDDRGRFLWADIWGKKVTILRSADAYRWQKLTEWDMDDAYGISLAQRSDGRYELFVAGIRYFTQRRLLTTYVTLVWRHLSRDGASWSQPQKLTQVEREEEICLSANHVGGRTLLAFFRANRSGGHQECLRLLRQRPDGPWEQSPDLLGVVTHCASMAHHPRWGYLIAWQLRSDDHFPTPMLGPYLIRGPSVDALFHGPAAAKEPG